MAKQNDSFSSGLGSVWIQPEGPNTKPDYLMCAELADLTKPRGEINRTYCVDPATGKWFVATRLRQPGDPPSTTITVPIGPTQRWLERIGDCPVAVYLHQNTGGRKDSFLAYDRAQVLPWAMVTQQTEANISMREANDQSTAAFEIESDWALVQYPMTKVRQTTAGVEPLNDVFFYNVRQCLGPNGSMKEVGVDGIAIADSEAAAAAKVAYTHDGGATWTLVDSPFIATCDLVSCLAFPVGPDTTRWLIVRSTEAATAMEIAYSDDDGANWTEVLVGATATEAPGFNGALAMIDAQHIWLCGDAGAAGTGNIYISRDGALTWTAQDPPSTDALNSMSFVDELTGMCVGDTDEILFTYDGGENWTLAPTAGAVGGQDILTCQMLDDHRAWIGYDDGTLYYTADKGTTWTQRVFTAPDGGTIEAINCIKFLDDYVGAFVLEYDTAAGAEVSALFTTHDGGYTWTHQPYIELGPFTEGAWHSLALCSPNKMYVVGGLIGGTAAIHKFDIVN